MSKLLVFVGATLSPLLFSSQFMHTYDDMKFLFIGTISVLLWCISPKNIHSDRGIKQLKWLWILFILSGFLSLTQAINPLQGLESISWWILLTPFAAIATYFSRAQQIRLFQLLLIPIVLVSLYGWVQILGFEPLSFHRDPFPVSFIGYKNMTGEFLLLGIPIILYFYFHAFSAKKRVQTILFGALFIVAVGHLYYTYSRGSQLAAIFSLMAGGFILLIRY